MFNLSSLLGRPVVIHAALRELSSAWKSSKVETSLQIVERIDNEQPCNIFVPSFTYSFTETGVFDQKNSPSEVGGFSEIVRQIAGPERRIMDPIFSAVALFGPFGRQDKVNTAAFGPDSLWNYIDEQDGVILNIGINDLVATQLHYIESRCKVPYRYNKFFFGTAINSGDEQYPVEYEYYVRNLEENAVWNRRAVEGHLLESGVISVGYWSGIQVRFIEAREMRKVLEPILCRRPRFLIEGF